MAFAYYENDFLSTFKVLFFHLVNLSNQRKRDDGFYNTFSAFDDKVRKFYSGEIGRWEMYLYVDEMVRYMRFSRANKIKQTLILMKDLLKEKGLYCDDSMYLYNFCECNNK